MKIKPLLGQSPNFGKINWHKDDPNATSVFDKRKIMIITTTCFFLGAIFVIIDAIISYFYIQNPYKYSYALIKNIKEPNFDLIGNYVYTAINSTDIEKFKENYLAKSAVDKEILDYVFYHKGTNGKNSERLFICNLMFGMIQFFAALISYNLKNFYGQWKMDLITLIIFESLGNISTLSIFAIWFLAEFGVDFKYFIYLNYHRIIHYIGFVFACFNLVLKFYIFSLSFFDYFMIVNKKLKNKEV